MAEARNRAVVQVRGMDYILVGKESEEYMQRVAAYVNRRMEEIGYDALMSEQRLVVLTALNLADELFKAKEEIAQLRREAAEAQRRAQAQRKGQ
ncbi:MAG: cell division protein ZapA [Christensenellaceae bacterium]|nr:cell division protein ZapA [Christensenellaceae bacterium]